MEQSRVDKNDVNGSSSMRDENFGSSSSSICSDSSSRIETGSSNEIKDKSTGDASCNLGATAQGSADLGGVCGVSPEIVDDVGNELDVFSCSSDGEDDLDEKAVVDCESAVTVKQFPQEIEGIVDGCGRGSPVIVSDKTPAEYRKRGEDAAIFVSQLKMEAEKLQDVLIQVRPDQWTDELFEPHMEALMGAFDRCTKKILDEAADFGIAADQPYRLGVIDQLCRILKDDDIGGVADASGAKAYERATVPLTGIWPLKKNSKDKKYSSQFAERTTFEQWSENYKSMDEAEEDYVAEINRIMNAEIEAGWVEREPEDCPNLANGVLGVVFEGWRCKPEDNCEGKCGKKCEGPKSSMVRCRPKLRIVWDGSRQGVNWSTEMLEKVETPSVNEKRLILEKCAREKRKVRSLKLDVASAFRTLLIEEKSRPFFGFNFRKQKWRYKCMPFGWKLAGWFFARHAGCVIRSLKVILAQIFEWFAGLIFVDDGIFYFCEDEIWLGVSVVMLLLRFLRVPISHAKTIVGQDTDWQGFLWKWKNGQEGVHSLTVGPKDRKYDQMVSALLQIIDCKKKIPFRLYEKFISQCSWLSTLYPYIKAWLCRSHRQIGKVRRLHESAASSSYHQRKLEDKAYIVKNRVIGDLPVIIFTLVHYRKIDFPLIKPQTSDFRTDACGTANSMGMGGWKPPSGVDCCEDIQTLYGVEYFSLQLHRSDIKEFKNTSPQKIIAALEMLTHLIGFDKFRGSKKVSSAQTDSMVSVYALASSGAKSWSLLLVLKAFSFYCLKNGIFTVSSHIRGELNQLADMLSRPEKNPSTMKLLKEVGKQVDVSIDDIKRLLKTPSMKDVEAEISLLRW